MQASEARLAANRANASLSTGPATAEGKAISSKNALTHGLTSAQVIIGPGEQEEFDTLLASFAQDFAPQGAAETALFNDIVHAVWQKRRIRMVEAQYVNGNPSLLLEPAVMAQLDRYRRYQSHYDRAHHKAAKALAELQRNRQLHRNARTEAATLDEPIPHDTHLLPPPAPPRRLIELRVAKQEAKGQLAERNSNMPGYIPRISMGSFLQREEPGMLDYDDERF
ncbi:MAG: hypothetical protein FJW40_00425 [Acidobacteria bacterium]|nr:hypothetical protein [Acidobacteriota bacterium]